MAYCICLSLLIAAASTEETFDVLLRMKEFDSLFESGFTQEAIVSCVDMVIPGKIDVGVKRRWRLTFEGTRVAYLMDTISHDTPSYVALNGVNSESSYSVAFRTRKWGYWGEDLSGEHYEDTVFKLDPSGTTETGKMHNSTLHGANTQDLDASRNTLLWAMGRFFSRNLDEVTSCEVTVDARLLVEAKGNRSGVRGRWQFEIEPSSGWIVRSAKFYSDRQPDRIGAEMKSEGSVWTGPQCVPISAEINPWGPLADDNKGAGYKRVVKVRFEPISQQFDEELFSEAKAIVANNQSPNLTLHDHRVEPTLITEPFRERQHKTDRVVKGADARLFWILMLNVIVFGGIITLLVAGRTRKGTS